jgi:hypothetical protein
VVIDEDEGSELGSCRRLLVLSLAQELDGSEMDGREVEMLGGMLWPIDGQEIGLSICCRDGEMFRNGRLVVNDLVENMLFVAEVDFFEGVSQWSERRVV